VLRGVIALLVAFFAVVAVVMVYLVPDLDATLPSKVLIVILAISGVGGAVSFFMVTRYSSDVTLDTSLWRFVWKEAPPDSYPEALHVWRWSRAFIVCWAAIGIAMMGIVTIECVVRG
jgi:hypothetical protein